MAQEFWVSDRTGPWTKGDLLTNVPLLAGPLLKIVDDTDQPVGLTYGTRLSIALIVAEPPGLLWLAPVLQDQDFPDDSTFDRLLVIGRTTQAGWFALDPLPDLLRRPSLAVLNMPSALPRDTLDVTGARRVATLSPPYIASITGAMHGCL